MSDPKPCPKCGAVPKDPLDEILSIYRGEDKERLRLLAEYCIARAIELGRKKSHK